MLTVGVMSILLVAAMPPATIVSATEAGASAGSHFQTFSGGWYNSLLGLESDFCLAQTGSNESLGSGFGSGVTVLVTNLTPTTSPGVCHTQYGIVTLFANSRNLKQVNLDAWNESATTSNRSAHERDYTVTQLTVIGTTVNFQYREQINFNNSTPIWMMPIGDPSGWDTGIGLTAGINLGDLTSSLTYGTCPVGGSAPVTFVWDGACFQKNYPILYPHDDRSFYSIFTTQDYWGTGSALFHTQFGTTSVSTITGAGGSIVTALVCAAIGAWIGAQAASAWGALVGAIIGAIFGVIAVYVGSTTLVDESGCIWFWLDQSILTSVISAPWYVKPFGPQAISLWVALNLGYFRLGDHTIENQISLGDP